MGISQAGGATRTVRQGCSVSIWFLLLSNLLVFQLTYYWNNSIFGNVGENALLQATTAPDVSTVLNNPLKIPQGPAVALPSVRLTSTEQAEFKRGVYGGTGDKAHLGGFTNIDIHGLSPATWKHMVQFFGVKSVLDVGCGRGISTSWFVLHGLETLCVEGSHDAYEQSMLPDPATQMVEHDFSRSPWWPPKTVDAVWCVEFLEHVGRNFHKNYFPAFRKAALIFVSHSQWGGWHHVEVHSESWWIHKFEMYGFKYSKEWTEQIRKLAIAERYKNIESPAQNQTYNGQHIWLNMQVFFNPAVASLPQHAHLLAEHGCFLRKDSPPRECGTGKAGPHETPLPKEFYPLNLTDKMDTDWFELVKRNIAA